jgi:conjugal transfer pilus assembly protein TrbC
MDIFDTTLQGGELIAIVATGVALLIGLGHRLGAFPAATIGSAIAAYLILTWAPSAFAQTMEEFVRRAEARGKSAEESVRLWVEAQKGREDRYRSEAEELMAANAGRIKQGFSYLDDSMWKAAAEEYQYTDPHKDGVVYVAVSLTMPPQALRQLAKEARAAGAVVVIRGLVGGSFQKTLVAAKGAFDQNSLSGVAIDPQVFRAFEVTRVPTFIVAKAPVEPCNGLDCDSKPTPNDRLAGNISLAEAMRLVAAKGQVAPDVARKALERMGG